MTDVIAWPPVGLTAWEFTRHDPVSRSRSLIDGRSRTSSTGRSRRLVTAHMAGVGQDRAGAGYVERLKALLKGGRHLVRVQCRSSIWRYGRSRFVNLPVSWTTAGDPLVWTSGDVALEWFSDSYPGAAGSSGGWPQVRVTGLPPRRIVARPDELVILRGDGEPQLRRAMRVVESDSAGVALIRLDAAMSGAGQVSIGERESVVMDAETLPRAVQPMSGDWAYEWSFREAFEDEYSDGWQEVNPW